jgi:hypothetical protein
LYELAERAELRSADIDETEARHALKAEPVRTEATAKG